MPETGGRSSESESSRAPFEFGDDLLEARMLGKEHIKTLRSSPDKIVKIDLFLKDSHGNDSIELTAKSCVELKGLVDSMRDRDKVNIPNMDIVLGEARKSVFF